MGWRRGSGTGRRRAGRGAQDDLVGRISARRGPAGEQPRRRGRTRAGPSRAAAARTVDRAGAVIAAMEMSSKPATETSPGTAIPSSARRARAPSARRSLAQHDRRERRAAREQRVDAAARRRRGRRPCGRRAARRTRGPPPRARGGSPSSRWRATYRDARPGEERDPPVAERGQRADHRTRSRPRCRRRPPARRARAARGGRPRRRRRASPRRAGPSPR